MVKNKYSFDFGALPLVKKKKRINKLALKRGKS